MARQVYNYVVVGGGVAGAAAVEGIRTHDQKGSILLIGAEKHLPYHRPPLSKQLWSGKKQVEDIFVHDRQYYDDNGVTLALGKRAVAIDAAHNLLLDDRGTPCQYAKLLLATGGVPRLLPVPGGEIEGLCYYRNLDDYLCLRRESAGAKTAVVIGGGFIGTELAAALSASGLEVTMIFPTSYFCSRVFPEGLGRALMQRYVQRGIRVLAEDAPESFRRSGPRCLTVTRNGKQIVSDLLVVGIGLAPEVSLAQSAGLETANGVVVDEQLQTSQPGIYAAGDNAAFPYRGLGQRLRVEHWDNAVNQGRWAGGNMAGARRPYHYLPYFFSDLFEFGYEAVGETDAGLEIFADWQKELDTGVIYYLRSHKVCGVMMCNLWGKVDAARALIRRRETASPESLRGAIR